MLLLLDPPIWIELWKSRCGKLTEINDGSNVSLAQCVGYVLTLLGHKPWSVQDVISSGITHGLPDAYREEKP